MFTRILWTFVAALLCLPVATAQEEEEKEPFADVVCRVNAAKAKIHQPKAVKVVSVSTLEPWGGMGVHSSRSPKWEKRINGGDVLVLNFRADKARPHASLGFSVPEDGYYFIYHRSSTWCCGIGVFDFRIDDGPVLKGGPWRAYSWEWSPLLAMRRYDYDSAQLSLSRPLRLKKGKHKLTFMRSHGCGDAAIYQIAIARKNLVQATKDDLKKNHQLALVYHVWRGEHEALAKVLAAKPNVDIWTPEGTPIMIAEYMGDRKSAEMLAAAGALPGKAVSGFIKALAERDAVTGKALLQEHRKLYALHFGHEDTPLLRAVQAKDPAMVKLLLAAGAEQAPKDPRKSPLAIAASKDDMKTFQVLLQAGANPRIDAMILARDSRLPMLKLAIGKGADPRAIKWGYSFLAASVVMRQLKCFEYLLSVYKKKRIPVPADKLLWLLDYSSKGYDAALTILPTLLKEGANINARGKKGNTILDSRFGKDPKVREVLLRNGAVSGKAPEKKPTQPPRR